MIIIISIKSNISIKSINIKRISNLIDRYLIYYRHTQIIIATLSNI